MAKIEIAFYPVFVVLLTLSLIILGGCADTTFSAGSICLQSNSTGLPSSSCNKTRTWNQPPPSGGIDEKSSVTPSSASEGS